MIESERDSENAIGTEVANGRKRETGTAKDLTVATKVEGREIIEAAAETGCIEIGAETVIATEIDIGTGEETGTRLDVRDSFALTVSIRYLT